MDDSDDIGEARTVGICARLRPGTFCKVGVKAARYPDFPVRSF